MNDHVLNIRVAADIQGKGGDGFLVKIWLRSRIKLRFRMSPWQHDTTFALALFGCFLVKIGLRFRVKLRFSMNLRFKMNLWPKLHATMFVWAD